MKLVLASYFEPQYHGEGRKIGISPGKPSNLAFECNILFDYFSPGDLYWNYQKTKNIDYEEAGKVFVSGYREQLDTFFAELKESAKEENKTIQELLPFSEGDTLLSWEKKSSTSYRAILAEYLREAGYDVEEN